MSTAEQLTAGAPPAPTAGALKANTPSWSGAAVPSRNAPRTSQVLATLPAQATVESASAGNVVQKREVNLRRPKTQETNGSY